MDLRVRLAARIPVADSDLRVTGSGRERMLAALRSAPFNDVLLEAARRRGLKADALQWDETPDPDGHNNTREQTASQFVLEERSGEVVTLRLNRPEKLNALNVEMAQALVHALLRASDDKGVRAVILTGAGRAFCSGGDLRFLLDARKRKAHRPVEELLIAGKEICLAIATMPKIVIAAVNGYAGGAGMNLALAADMRIASDKAQFSEAFARVGLYADLGGTYFLPRIVGPALAAEYSIPRKRWLPKTRFGWVL